MAADLTSDSNRVGARDHKDLLDGRRCPVSTHDFRIASLSHTTDADTFISWWRPGCMGYTTHLDEAGLYRFEVLRRSPDYYGAFDLLIVPDYVARRLVSGIDRLRNTLRVWQALQLVALYEHLEPHPFPVRRKRGLDG